MTPNEIKDILYPLVADGMTNLEIRNHLYNYERVHIPIMAIRVMRGVILKEMYPSQHPDLDLYTKEQPQRCTQRTTSTRQTSNQLWLI